MDRYARAARDVTSAPGVVRLLATPGWLSSMPVLVGLCLLVLDLGLRVAVLGIIPSNRRPSSAMAWLLLVYLVPSQGSGCSSCSGATAVGRRRPTKQAEVNARCGAVPRRCPPGRDDPGPTYVRSVATLNRNLGSLPCLAATSGPVPRLRGVDRGDDRRDRRRPSTFVHVEFYITAWDDVTGPFFEALVRAAKRGVRCRCSSTTSGRAASRATRKLKPAGRDRDRVAPDAADPAVQGESRRPDLRNHRKILVVDGVVAFTGSQNLIEPGYNKPKNHELGREWVELVAR